MFVRAVSVLMVVLAALQWAAPAAAQKYQVPRTAWGDPDLTGIWPANDMQGTPLERDPKLGTRNVLSDGEFALREMQSRRQAEQDAETVVVERRASTGPPSHWGERGKPQRQASLIVDPPDGRLPAMTPEGEKRAKAMRSTYWYDFPTAVEAHPFEQFTDLGPYDRCLTRGPFASMMPTGYNMGTQIFQIPDFVIIQNEMIHEVRVIPLDGRPHISPKIKSYMGDSRGRWEGDTLVVETTNHNGKVGLTRNGNTTPTSEQLRIVERFTRVAEDTLQYEATIEDPVIWTRPWKVSLPFRLQNDYGMFEYACHEGNYGMRNILAGARAEEARTAVFAAQQAAAQGPGRGGAGQTVEKIRQLKPDLYMITGGGANTLVRVTKEGLIVVDTKNPGDENFNRVMEEIRTVSMLPVRYVINTQHHPDHVGNNQKFIDAGAQVVALEAVKTHMASDPRTKAIPGLPTQTFAKDHVVKLGGAEVRLYSFGRGHSGGDTIAYFPDARVVMVSDQITDATPIVDFANGGSAVGWTAILDGVLKLDFEMAIPGRGEPKTRAEVEAYRTRFATVVSRASEAIKAGATRDQLAAQVKTDDLGWQFNAQFWGQVYDELTKK